MLLGAVPLLPAMCNFFFVPQDLIGRINSYSERISFQSNLFLLVSNILRSKLFLMKISILHWNDAAYTCKDKLWRKVANKYQMS